MAQVLPIARPVLFPLWAVVDGDDGTKECGCGDENCDRIGKHPQVKWGTVEFPGYERPPAPSNYAIKTGAAPAGSNVFVLDADDETAMAEVMHLNGGVVPDTFTVRTARGAHYYFQLPDFPVRRSVHELHPKIDIVGEHWWVVGPGSRHKTGVTYEVIRDVPPAPCPAWLSDWPGLRAKPQADVQTYSGDVTAEPELGYRRAKFVEFCKRSPPSIEGKAGDLALWKVVQHGALDLRLPNAVILDVMREHFDPRCEPPWGDALAERVIHKAHSAKTQSTRPAKEPLSFKIASLTNRLEAAGHVAESPTTAREIETKRRPLETAEPADTAGDSQVANREIPRGKDTDADSAAALPFIFGGWDVEPPPIKFRVDGLLPEGAIAMFYGRADSMKTWLLYAMAKALAEGAPFLGTYKTKQSRVGIVDYETGRSNVARRLYMLRVGKNDNLGAVSFAKLKPSMPEFWEALLPYHFDVVFVDSLRKANPGGDENDSGEAILPLELAAEFAEATGCAVVFIHHAKKAATDGWPEFRGSAAIEDQVDCAYAVRKTDVNATKKTVEIRCEKPGDMRTPDPFAADVEFDDANKRALVTLCTDEAVKAAKEAETKTLQNEIKKVLVTATPLKPMHWRAVKARLADFTPTEIDVAMSHLVEAGDVTKLKATGGGGYFLDNEAGRKKRVAEAVDSGSYKTIATLADGATVDAEYIKRLVKTGIVLFEAGRFSMPKANR